MSLSREKKRGLVQFLHAAGCCDRCVLRFLKVYLPASYDNATSVSDGCLPYLAYVFCSFAFVIHSSEIMHCIVKCTHWWVVVISLLCLANTSTIGRERGVFQVCSTLKAIMVTGLHRSDVMLNMSYFHWQWIRSLVLKQRCISLLECIRCTSSSVLF